MAIYNQNPKQVIDVGEVGDANTGDIIYDGGVKINKNNDAIYNAFGDQRLYNPNDTGQTEGRQTIHATGYYQKLPTSDYTSGLIPIGSRHDLDTSGGSFVVNLPRGVRGEMVEFINSSGSFSTNHVTFQSVEGETIVDSGRVDFRIPFSHVSFVCTNDTPGDVMWEYKVTPMFGDFSVPANVVEQVDANTEKTITLFRKDLYDGVKLMISAKDQAGVNKTYTISEILLMIDGDNVYSTEYSTLVNNSAGTRNVELAFETIGNYVVVKATAGSALIKLAIKSIETIKA